MPEHTKSVDRVKWTCPGCSRQFWIPRGRDVFLCPDCSRNQPTESEQPHDREVKQPSVPVRIGISEPTHGDSHEPAVDSVGQFPEPFVHDAGNASTLIRSHSPQNATVSNHRRVSRVSLCHCSVGGCGDIHLAFENRSNCRKGIRVG